MNVIELRLNSFYSCFNSMSRDLKFLNINNLMFLFNSYCCPDIYGLSLWNDASTIKSNIFRTFETAYSNALKRMSGVPLYASSHITAERFHQLLLRHLTALIQARFLKRHVALRIHSSNLTSTVS